MRAFKEIAMQRSCEHTDMFVQTRWMSRLLISERSNGIFDWRITEWNENRLTQVL